MLNSSQKLLIPYDIFPVQFQMLVHDNRDILNYVFSESFLKPKGMSYKKVAVKFRDKLDALEGLVNDRLLMAPQGEEGDVQLTFYGLIFSDDKDAKDLLNVIAKAYALLRQAYIDTNGEYKCSLKELTDKVYTGNDLPQRYDEMSSLLNGLNTAHFSPITFYMVSLDAYIDKLTPSDIQGTQRILKIEKFSDYVLQCLEMLSINLKKKYTVKEDVAITDEESRSEQAYNILKEEFKFEGKRIIGKEYKCFVIMPIGDKDDNPVEHKNNMAVFNQIVKPCVENSGYEINCYHANDELVTKTGDISKQIFDAIQNDDIAIVDLRRQNPNVIYEMCMRHFFGKRTIPICSDFNQNFFHGAKHRAIKYCLNGESNQEFYRRMQATISDIVKNPEQSDNPIRDLLGTSLARFEGTKIEDKSEASAIEGMSKVAQDILLQCIKDDKSEFIDEYMVIALSQTKMKIEIGCDELIERELIYQSYANYGDETHYALTPNGRKMADALTKKQT